MERRSLQDLRPHPRNSSIYAGSTAASDDLITSVRLKGVLTPVLITHDNRIISGHRRCDAAARAGLHEVPVAVYGSTDELDILETLIHTNRQRAKNGEIVGREAVELEDIGQQREAARQRKLATLKQNVLPTVVEMVPQRNGTGQQNGKSRDAIGAAIGVSGKTAEKAAEVERAARRLEASGDAEEAAELRKTQRGSVARAYQAGRRAGYIVPKRQKECDVDYVPVSLEQWQALLPQERTGVLARRDPGARFNKQSTASIEWARWSWNPVTGCLHNCSYCYARDIAERRQQDHMRAYLHGFAPALQADRLGAAAATPVPQDAVRDIGLMNVFTCSMADLFGKWVPREWIEAVLAEVRANPQWNFLFLTKFALRLAEFEFPSNAWVGTTIDAQARIPNAEKAFARVHAGVKWLSCEPLLERLTFSRLDLFDWVVIGGASRSTQTPEFRPPREWVDHLEAQCAAAGCAVYEKDNLLQRHRGYPGQPAATPVNVPAAFKMGYLQRDVAAHG